MPRVGAGGKRGSRNIDRQLRQSRGVWGASAHAVTMPEFQTGPLTVTSTSMASLITQRYAFPLPRSFWPAPTLKPRGIGNASRKGEVPDFARLDAQPQGVSAQHGQ